MMSLPLTMHERSIAEIFCSLTDVPQLLSQARRPAFLQRCRGSTSRGGSLICRRFRTSMFRDGGASAPQQQRNRIALPRGENRIMLASGEEGFLIQDTAPHS